MVLVFLECKHVALHRLATTAPVQFANGGIEERAKQHEQQVLCDQGGGSRSPREGLHLPRSKVDESAAFLERFF